MTTRSDVHTETAQVFLAKARTYLTEGDLLQASEKGRGAAAQIVKAAAEQRGWRNRSHGDLFEVVRRLANEADDSSLCTLFLVANGKHNNCYDGELPKQMIADGLDQVDEFVRRVDQLAD